MGNITLKSVGIITLKKYRPDQEIEIQRTPAVLPINTDFVEFDPQNHKWALLNFGDCLYEVIPGAYKFREI